MGTRKTVSIVHRIHRLSAAVEGLRRRRNGAAQCDIGVPSARKTVFGNSFHRR
ncbi:hypothetical protein OPAG_02423 [Rhodococcus opacus PD630]|nr:hypothetical protein OPAG_02423 [Rhodococcus opacus PD630]